MKLEQLDVLLSSVQKPARYCGGEVNQVNKTLNDNMLRYAFCFPDIYEVGMSHLGMKILYSHANLRDDVWCERVFAPESDMQELMKEFDIPLYGLESLDPIKNFDLIGFSMMYEMCYTEILNMMELAHINIHAKDRKDIFPLIVCGGPCSSNPEPMAEFVDYFVLGDGEDVDYQIFDLIQLAKKDKWSKEKLLLEISKLEGTYVPSLYDVTYNDDGTIKEYIPKTSPKPLSKKHAVRDLENVFYPDKFVVPYIETIFDRAQVELFRGCTRGCRFCQAGFLYRPIRVKSAEVVTKDAKNLVTSGGYEELGLTSLSTSDYPNLEGLLDNILNWCENRKVNISLPSLRIDNFSESLLEKISRVKKSGLTFAPEAGTQRLRDVINKNVTEEDVLNTCRIAFKGGYSAVKLYFMLGLPTETYDDIKGIADLAQKVVDLYYSMPDRPKGKSVSVNISLASFVPKPFTPFEFEPQDTMDSFKKKQEYLLSCLNTKKITVSYHVAFTSLIEAVLARGDRKLSKVIESAYRNGSRLDAWSEHFNEEAWKKAFIENNIDTSFYANRKREYTEVFPWDMLDYGVTKEYFIRENKKSKDSITTSSCMTHCNGCGADSLCEGKCYYK